MTWREMERRAELDAAQPRPTEIGEDRLQLSLTLGKELDQIWRPLPARYSPTRSKGPVRHAM
jgi:hypothetical protein